MTTASKHSIIMLLTLILTLALNYSFNIAMGWLLTPTEFGILGVSSAFLAILGLFVSSGFPRTVTKFISEKENQEKNQIVKTALVANIALGLIVALIFYTLVKFSIIKLEQVYQPLVLIIILILIIASISLIYKGILQGLFRFKALSIVLFLEPFFRLIFAVLLVYLGYSVLGAMIGSFIGVFISLLFAIYFARDFKFLRSAWAKSNIYFFAFPMFLGALFLALITTIDILSVKFFNSDTFAGYYQAVIVLARFPYFIAGAMVGALFPHISKHSSNPNSEPYSRKTIKYAVLFILPINLALAIIPEALITFVFPSSYLIGARALSILAIGMGFFVLITVFASIFQARNKPKIPAIALMFAVIIDGIALIVLVPKYNIVGAALSTTIACFIGLILLIIVYDHYTSTSNIIKTLIAYAVFGFLVYALPHYSRVLTILDLGVSGMVYLVALLVLGLLREEDVRIILSGVLPGAKRL